MNPTGKAGRPRIKPPKLTGETQFERFVETAKALDADGGGAQFLRAMDLLAPPASQNHATCLTKRPEKQIIDTPKKSGSAD